VFLVVTTIGTVCRQLSHEHVSTTPVYRLAITAALRIAETACLHDTLSVF